MSCGGNIFCWVLGDPAPAGPRQAFDAAMRDLRAARLSGNKPAERAALARMQAASNKMKQASSKAVGKVAKIDHAIATAGSVFTGVSKTMLYGGALLLLLLIMKK